MFRICNIVQGCWWINNLDSPNNYVCSGWSQLSQSIAENSDIYSLLFRGSWDPQIFLFPCAKLRQNLLQGPLQSLVSTRPMNPFYYVIHISKTRFWRQNMHFSFLLCYRLFPKVLAQDTLPASRYGMKNFKHSEKNSQCKWTPQNWRRKCCPLDLAIRTLLVLQREMF